MLSTIDPGQAGRMLANALRNCVTKLSIKSPVALVMPMVMKEKPSKSTSRIPRRYVVGTILVSTIIIALFVVADLQPYFEYRAKKNKICELIPIGSNIDEADRILDEHGFNYFPKDFATVYHDYYCLSVTVTIKPRPITLTIPAYLGVHVYFHYVVIEAGLDNKVRKIF